MIDATDAAITFEAVKASLNQNKDGVALRLVLHPDECPKQLITDWVGARYRVVLVRLGDDEQPVASDDTVRRNRAVKSAGMLCRNDSFQAFMFAHSYAEQPDDPGERDKAVADGLRALLNVRSRAELATDDDALRAFESLRDDFMKWRYLSPGNKASKRGDD